MIKFTTKPHMKAGPKYSLDPAPSIPDALAEDHEPLFKIKDFPQNYITFHVHKNTATKRKARHHNVIHISDLDPARQWCPREPALLTYLNLKRPDSFMSTAQTMVFKMGYAGADLLMDLMPAAQVWGHWKCMSCKHEMKFTYKPAACQKCSGRPEAFRYKEVLLRDPETGIVGSVDCFFDVLSNGVRTGVEIKTEGNDTFKKRTKPTFDHEWRSKGYLWLMGQDPYMQGKGLNPNEMRIVYFTKEGWDYEPKIKDWPVADSAKTAIKEYWCPKDDSVVQNQIDLARAYRKWRNLYDKDQGIHLHALPDRSKHCKSVGCTRAKACPVRKQCWGGKFDAHSGD